MARLLLFSIYQSRPPMKRPIWNGTISFGLLNIPVVLYAGEKRVDLHFRMIDSRDNTPIRYERVNAETGEEVPWKDIVQAFEYEKGSYVILSKKDIETVAPEGKEAIEIESFVDRTAISPIYFDKPYYLLPGKKSEKGYVLLRETLRRKNCAGIGHVIIRTRRYLCAVIVEEDMLILNLLRFQQEISDKSQFEFPAADFKKLRISSAEINMAEKLIDSMTTKWQPENHKDDYRERLLALVDSRLSKKEALVQEVPSADDEEPLASNVVDFMELLKNSLNKKAASPPATAKRPSRKSTIEKPKSARKKSTKRTANAAEQKQRRK